MFFLFLVVVVIVVISEKLTNWLACWLPSINNLPCCSTPLLLLLDPLYYLLLTRKRREVSKKKNKKLFQLEVFEHEEQTSTSSTLLICCVFVNLCRIFCFFAGGTVCPFACCVFVVIHLLHCSSSLYFIFVLLKQYDLLNFSWLHFYRAFLKSFLYYL